MKQKLWSKDWFGAATFTLVFIILAFGVFADSFESLERYTYDLGVRAHKRTPSDKIAVIAIDDQSIANLGRWPWPRNLHAQMIDLLSQGGARVIGNTVFYSEAQQDPGLKYVNEIYAQLAASPLATTIPGEIQTFSAILDDAGTRSKEVKGVASSFQQSALMTQYTPAVNALAAKLKEARAQLSADNVLSKAISDSGRVVIPMIFDIARPQGRPDAALPNYVRKNALSSLQDRVEAKASGKLPLPAINPQIPVAELGNAAYGIGHLNDSPDPDGAIRVEPLVLQYFDEFYPSFALMVAAKSLNLTPKDIEVRLGEGIAMSGLEIATEPDLLMYTHYYAAQDGQSAFPVDSFYDVLTHKIPASKYKDKIVLIGPTAKGVGTTFATPIAPVTSPVVALAHKVSSILQQDYFTRPAWAGLLEFGILILLALYLALALPKLPAGLAAGISGGIIVALLVSQTALMAVKAQWLQFTIPAVFLALGHGFMLLKRFRITEHLKTASEAEGSESNKMLGLAFQGQGQLDMAFEKFSRVQPVDDRLLDLLYNLALDFERKRQFNKAESVYQHIAKHNKEFRDVQLKLNRAKRLSETVILGGAGGSHPGGTMIMDNDATQQMEKPMLGRYQVERELGKGAMGIVYLGKDPKIGRTVAIKTMSLAQEFDADELTSVKQRFFREAETAGRLSHPNIVQIFDAGEEQDLAYIAMEFIKGHDLTKHVKNPNLLPVPEVLRYIADAAEALDYAHTNSVVHRDIKPANMMLLAETKTIKLMDFGIARLTDSSKTKTGMVLGTPSYMSPEQLSGKKVDGRSDLFSLGVTLYQLLCGQLPFQADSMATLMFKIANEPHTPLHMVRADLPAKLNQIVERSLNKEMDQRYQRGNDLAQELRSILSGGQG